MKKKAKKGVAARAEPEECTIYLPKGGEASQDYANRIYIWLTTIANLYKAPKSRKALDRGPASFGMMSPDL